MTADITLSDFWAPLSLGIVFAAAWSALALWRHRIQGAPLAPSMRAAFYLQRYAFALEYYGLSGSDIKSHVEELRADLAAADSADIDATLHRLGPPRTLAAAVTSGVLRPSLLRGSIWFGIAAFSTLAIGFLIFAAFLGGFEAVAEPGDQASWSALGFDFGATMDADGRGSTIEFGIIALVLYPVGAFILGTRPWRLFTQSKPKTSTSIA